MIKDRYLLQMSLFHIADVIYAFTFGLIHL